MALELPGSFLAALTIGLFVWALRKRVTAIPAWAVPLLAGIGMIGTTIWMEDTWFDRVSRALPAGFAVANEESGSSPLRPWT